jgi:hypothetical protein
MARSPFGVGRVLTVDLSLYCTYRQGTDSGIGYGIVRHSVL